MIALLSKAVGKKTSCHDWSRNNAVKESSVDSLTMRQKHINKIFSSRYGYEDIGTDTCASPLVKRRIKFSFDD